MYILSQKQQNINGKNKNICLAYIVQREATKSLTKIKMTGKKLM